MILFSKLTFCNFLSAGNAPVSFNLNQNQTTLIHGMNGSGKSTILDALTYSLFGRPFRKLNLPQLINSQNKKGLLVEVEFSIGNNQYKVLRGHKPKVFKIEVNGKELNARAADKDNQAHLEGNILKMNYKTFTQVVILGSSNFVPFMQLSTQGRRECIEDFLDIKVFSSMALIAKERLRGLKEALNTCKNDLSSVEYKLEIQQERINEIESRTTDDIKEYNRKIKETKKISDKDTKSIEKCKKTDEGYVAEISSLMQSNPRDNHTKFNNVIIKLENKMERLVKETQFYQTNDTCPTCSQSILQDTKNSILTRNDDEVSKLTDAVFKAKDVKRQHSETLQLIEQVDQKVMLNNQEIYKLETNINNFRRLIEECNQGIDKINSDTSNLDKEKGKLEVIQDQSDTLTNRLDEMLVSMREHEIVVNLLKESGIKTQVVKKYLPFMNRCITKYLQELDFPIHFMLDDQFNETVSSPMHQDFSYGSFSEGQKARIDLALMFTWREIGRLKNSVSTNLLVLDEVFSSSLDDAGKEALFAILRYRLPDTRVVVIDHTLSQNFKEKFENTIEVQRIKGFSTYLSATNNVG